ncbi:hypothetical protein ACFQ1M_16550 [Sungkyunkwania multivorans]|uniref:TMhelix containing protein n=1 Tax=Sungkyunkwania multivorans TaxID=1173618 RepID=A0ABW3D1I8_9FLAO
MKISAMSMVAITTIMLVLVTLMVSLEFAFSWVFYATCLGQALVVIMVYKVLTDDYSTEKTFDDFYEDRPIDQKDQ